MQIHELMSTDVVSVPSDATLAEVVSKLLTNDVGSVIVVDGTTPTGIVTETDVLEIIHETGDPVHEIAITDIDHGQVHTTDPSTAVSTVARRMADTGVKKLPVMDGIELVGIITLTDIVWHLSDLRSEVRATEHIQEQWSPS
jgi:CBS domain-containing protein